MQHIEDLTHRIEFKCTLEPQINEEVVTNSSVKSDEITTKEPEPMQEQPIENPRIPVPEHIQPEPKKRGFLSRFFLPNG